MKYFRQLRLSFKNWNPYVFCKYKTISEGYKGVDKYNFSYWICAFTTFNCTVVKSLCKTKHILIVCLHFSTIYYIFIWHATKFWIFIDYLTYAQKICLMPCCWLCTVSLFIILLTEGNSELPSNWCQIWYLKNLFLGSLKSLRNGFVFGTNIKISIVKWIMNDNSKFNINCAVEQTLQHSLVRLFWDTLYILGTYKDSSVGNYKYNTERAPTAANKSMGFDPKETQSCWFVKINASNVLGKTSIPSPISIFQSVQKNVKKDSSQYSMV